MPANISLAEKTSALLALVGQPARIQILFAIRDQEACVCHLEAALGMRQASISQHLMALRRAGVVTTQRQGRNIFYRLCRAEAVDLLRQAARLAGCDPAELDRLAERPVPGCPCPQCNPDLDPRFTCKSFRK